MKTDLLFVTILSLVLLASCAAQPAPLAPTSAPAEPTVSATPAWQQVATSEAGSSEPTPSAQPAAPDLASICPAETEGTALHVSAENGWCFLYPSSLQLQADVFRPEEVIHLVGAPLDPSATETVAVDLSLAYNGPADGLDSAQYASSWLDLNLPGRDMLEEHTTIGGQPAVIFNNLPGMLAQRGAFLVANEVKYQLMLQPQPQDVPELAKEAAQAWDTVTQTIVFFPPQNARVECGDRVDCVLRQVALG